MAEPGAAVVLDDERTRPVLGDPDTTQYAQWAGEAFKFHSRDQIVEYANARVLAASPQPAQTERALTNAPVFDAKHVSLKQRADGKLVLTLLLDGVECALRYKVSPINPAVVRAAAQPASGGDRD
jgi:hypothetical protein